MKHFLSLLLTLCTATCLIAEEAATDVKHTTGKDAKALLDAKDAKIVVIDVRTPAEYAEGHIAGAKNINFNDADFAEKLGAVDRKQTVLVHCGRGGRSTSSLEVFKKLGFKTVIHLDGGFSDWVRAGHPVEK